MNWNNNILTLKGRVGPICPTVLHRELYRARTGPAQDLYSPCTAPVQGPHSSCTVPTLACDPIGSRETA